MMTIKKHNDTMSRRTMSSRRMLKKNRTTNGSTVMGKTLVIPQNNDEMMLTNTQFLMTQPTRGASRYDFYSI
jgi:hypothetical protein